MEDLLSRRGDRRCYAIKPMCFSILFIKEPQDWATITNAAKALTRKGTSDIRFIGDVENLSDDKSVVDVVVMQLTGKAD